MARLSVYVYTFAQAKAAFKKRQNIVSRKSALRSLATVADTKSMPAKFSILMRVN